MLSWRPRVNQQPFPTSACHSTYRVNAIQGTHAIDGILVILRQRLFAKNPLFFDAVSESVKVYFAQRWAGSGSDSTESKTALRH